MVSHAELEKMVAEYMKAKPQGKETYDSIADKYVGWLCDNGVQFLRHKGTDYFWDGRQYQTVVDLASRVRHWLRNVAGIPQTNSLVDNLVNAIRTVGYDPAREGRDMPFWDGPGEPRNTVAFANGLLDITRVEEGLTPHSWRWHSTTCLPYDYDPTATCPACLDFLGQVYEGDPGRIGLLQEWAGYLLSGDTSLHKILLLVGAKRAGKSTILEVLENLVGRDNSCATSFRRITGQHGLWGMLGKSACFIGEGDKGAEGATEILKDVSGGGLQTVERKFLSPVSTRLGVRFNVAANSVPAVWDASGALAGRLLVLEHAVTFYGREDRGLPEKLARELPGIANWALQGLARLRANGKFTVPEKTGLALRVEMESAPMTVFLRERCSIARWADTGEPGLHVVDDDLDVVKQQFAEAFAGWCSDHGLTVRNGNWAAAELRTVLPKVKDGKSTPPSRVNTYRGLTLRRLVD